MEIGSSRHSIFIPSSVKIEGEEGRIFVYFHFGVGLKREKITCIRARVYMCVPKSQRRDCEMEPETFNVSFPFLFLLLGILLRCGVLHHHLARVTVHAESTKSVDSAISFRHSYRD